MRLPQKLATLSLLLLVQSPSEACRLFRGGCSDPCSVATRGGYRAPVCSGCGSPNHDAYHQPVSGYTVTSSPVHVHSSSCQTCGLQPQAAMPAVVAPAVMGNAATTQFADCGPITTYQVVLQPEYFTESRPQAYTDYREETRYRTRTIARQVPVEVQDYRTTTIMVPKTETKTVEYSVLVPKTSEKVVDIIESVPVWNEVTEEYTVRVPELVDVTEEYTVQVAKLRDEQFDYTVYVPQVQKQQKVQRVTNVVPVTKTRTIQVSRPVTRTQVQTKDYGHWETRVEQAPGYSIQPGYTTAAVGCGVQTGGCGVQMGGCETYGSPVMHSSACGYSGRSCGSCGGCATGGCGGCGVAVSNCGAAGYSQCGQSYAVSSYSQSVAPVTVTRQVWVPNLVTEEVAVIENVVESQEIAYTAFEQQAEDVAYESTYMVYAPETRTGTRQVVEYVPESRTRTRKVVEYKDETRTRVHKELTYKQETRQQTIPVVQYVSEPRTKEVNYTIQVPETKVEPITRTTYQTVQEEVSEEYTVRVPFTAYRDIQVQVSRMVPKLVPVTIYPCSGNASAANTAAGNYSGCDSCGVQTLPAPTQTGCAACGN